MERNKAIKLIKNEVFSPLMIRCSNERKLGGGRREKGKEEILVRREGRGINNKRGRKTRRGEEQ